MKKILKCMMIFSLCITLLTGCANNRRNRIAYTIYPIGYLIERIAGDVVQYQSIQKDIDVMVQNATIADNFEEILGRSQVLFHLGNLEPYLAIHQKEITASGVQEEDLSVANAVYDFARYTQKTNEEGETSFEQSPYYEGSEFDTVDITTKDLSLWLDPIAMLSMAEDICDWLVHQIPDQEALFEKNFSTLQNELISLDAQYLSFARAYQKNGQRIAFASMSSSFGNWQKAYGIEVYPIVLSMYGSLPTSSQLAEIEKILQENQVKYIAYESNMSEQMIELFNQVSADLDLKRVDLSNLSSLSAEEKSTGKDYFSIMYQNLVVLQSMIQDGEEIVEKNASEPAE